MQFKSRKSLIVRFVLILTLLGGMPGVRNVQAAPLEADGITTVLVVSPTGVPLASKPVYAFNGSTFTGYSRTTDVNGEAAFTLPEGSYRFRVDVDGTQFWSGPANHCDNCLSVVVTIPEPVLVTVQNTDGTPMAGLNVYAFNSATYTGFHGTTDQNGQYVLRLPEGSYRFRADLNGTQFWSGASNHCNVSGCTGASITVSKPMIVTVLDTDGAPKAGLNVYAFNGSTYTGYNKTTNAEGQAVFTLPLGSYRFRADLNGTQFWSGISNHCDIPSCESASVTVSKPVTVTILDTDGEPKTGLNVYAFNGSTYSGYSKTTNTAGLAIFTLPLGSYRFRADLNGTQFWSGTSNHCTLPGCDSAQVTVTLPLTVLVQDGGGTPKSGVNVYAFNGSTYTGYSKVSDANGQAIFTLPLGSYRFRADYSGVQYWSGTANHCILPGCLNVSVTVGPAMTATALPTSTFTATPTLTPTATSTPTFTPTHTATSTPTAMVPVTRVVINTNDSGPGSLRQAVLDSASGDTIKFAPALAGQTITLTSSLTIDTSVVVDGSGLSPQVIISGGNVANIRIPYVNRVTIYDLTIANGHSTYGGAIEADGYLMITNSTLRNNVATASGGAIVSGNGLILINSTIYQNQASSGGALLVNGNSEVVIINSTITQNQAGSGGALYANGGANLDIFNSTIAGNNATRGAEYFINGGVTAHLDNTVFACTLDNEGNCYFENGPVIVVPHSSVIGFGALEGFGLGELDESGGPTKTMALLPGSFLIDGGDDAICSSPWVNHLDQRGVTRPQGAHCDIGAYEYEETPPTSTPTSTSTPTEIPTDTPTSVSTPTFTPTPGPTPVLGCSSISNGVGTIKLSTRNMYLDIPNPNPYSVTISSVFVAWNYDRGHIPGDARLFLQSADLNGTVFWTGNLNQPGALLPLSTVVNLPANSISRITFTFDKTYSRASGTEQIQIQFSTPGCEAYPVVVPASAPTITPVPR